MMKDIKALGYDFGYEQGQLAELLDIRRDAGCVEMEGVYMYVNVCYS